MPSPRRPLPRAVRLSSALVAVLVAAGGALVACSSGDSSSTDPTLAAAAAAVVGETFHIPDDAQTCLEQELARDSTAREALVSTDELDAGQRQAVAEVLEACITVDQWAAAIAGRITAAVPPSDPARIGTQVSCLTTEVKALDEARRRALVVGLVVIGSAPATGELAVERGDVLNGLYATCSVESGSASTSASAVPSTPSTAAAG